MRDYIKINGVSSETISGLLIQSLPAISKPRMRVNTIEIDGRAGDITTDLGYSAYDKEISIGLYGDFRIDDVISYFTSSGKVVFSNEPDKYYNFQIIDQIDFIKLIRFKTARVKFHVQPYKYSVIQGIKALNITDQTSLTVNNMGNTVALPIITVVGSGTVNLSLNDRQIFTINFSDTVSSVSIDAQELEAYNENGLQNRAVSGNYDNLQLKTGINTISWTGNVTRISLEKYSRWI